MKRFGILCVLGVLLFTGCSVQPQAVDEPLSLMESALEVAQLLKDKDFVALEDWVDSEKGLRVSPYGYISLEENIGFTKEALSDLMDSDTILQFGQYDGSGEPMTMTFSEYYNRFIYDADFLNPQVIGINTLIGYGNTYVNIKEAYPDAEFVELHFKEIDPQYEGMDWRSLYLIFEKQEDGFKLIHIAHGEWTI